MKILKKPKIPEQTCKKCGCVVKITPKDLVPDNSPLILTAVKDCFKCPICFTCNRVKFEKENEKTEAAENE